MHERSGFINYQEEGRGLREPWATCGASYNTAVALTSDGAMHRYRRVTITWAPRPICLVAFREKALTIPSVLDYQ